VSNGAPVGAPFCFNADGGADFHGQKRKNDTHASTTDPDSRLYRKAVGREAKLSYMGHVTMENRHGLAVAGMVTLANGTAERRAAEAMLKAKAKEVGHRITVGEDKAYDTADHVANLRAINVTPHVTQNASLTSTGKRRQSAIDARTTRHEGYGMSQSRRAMIECIFGWGKQHGTMRKTKHRGRLVGGAGCGASAGHGSNVGRGLGGPRSSALRPLRAVRWEPADTASQEARGTQARSGVSGKGLHQAPRENAAMERQPRPCARSASMRKPGLSPNSTR
jgi:hypothetical protein